MHGSGRMYFSKGSRHDQAPRGGDRRKTLRGFISCSKAYYIIMKRYYVYSQTLRALKPAATCCRHD
jgi:hypothetical protein